MKKIFLFFISLTLFSAKPDFDLSKRWINEKGWPVPDVNKLSFIKSEVLKEIIPEWICVKTYAINENSTYTLKTNEVGPNYKVGNKLIDIDIHRVSIYSLCESKEILFYLVSMLVVEERNPEYGIAGYGLEVIYVDMNHDGIFESLFNGADVNPNEPNGTVINALKYFAEKWRSQKFDTRKK